MIAFIATLCAVGTAIAAVIFSAWVVKELFVQH